jgi:hypothetical protein
MTDLISPVFGQLASLFVLQMRESLFCSGENLATNGKRTNQVRAVARFGCGPWPLWGSRNGRAAYPTPPPPGVLMINTSPGETLKCAVPANRSSLPSAR